MEKSNKNTIMRIVMLLAMCLLSFSTLLTFSERISIKPTEAGFWMIFVFGLTIGVALVGIPVMLFNQKKRD